MKIEATSITNATAGELLLEGEAAIARGEVAFDLSSVTGVGLPSNLASHEPMFL